MAELEVFWGSGSQPSWRVLLALEIKRVPYVSHRIDFSAGDHKKPEFLAMNPRHQVPTIKHGDYTLYESTAILCYLDAKYKTPPLFGSTPEETGLVWRWIAEFIHYLEPVLHGRIVSPLFFGKAEQQAASIRESIQELHAELAHWEHRLASHEWLVGERISAADVQLFPSLMALIRAAGKPGAEAFDLGIEPLSAGYPNLDRWVARIQALPGYQKTYPPHWRE